MDKKYTTYLNILLVIFLVILSVFGKSRAAPVLQATPTPGFLSSEEAAALRFRDDPNLFAARLFGEPPAASGERVDTLPDGAAAPIPAALASHAVAVANGLSFSCMLSDTGGVKCWGDNVWGQLGNGSTVNSNTPVDVIGLSSGVIKISAMHKHVCALLETGAVKCWGRNYHGELGNNSNVNSAIPVDVAGLSSGVTDIAVGGFHACAVLYDTTLKCWGYNFHGQLGDSRFGIAADSWTPVDVVESSGNRMFDFVGVAAGKYHTCGILLGGETKCWGHNAFGQIGDGSDGYEEDRYTPVGVSDLSSGVAALALGERHSCARMASGGMKCWGGNSEGQLGLGTTELHNRPVDVPGLTDGVTSIAAGIYHTCAVANGGLWCWGDNWAGQVGDDTRTSRLSPVWVSGLAGGVVAAAGGDSHTCAVTADGSAWCWGSNAFGQLGNRSSALHLAPAVASGLSANVVAVTAGALHACALLESGAVRCWGNNRYGQLGDGSATDSLTPVDVAGLSSGVTAIEAGAFHTCAIANGALKCWGANDTGQLGNGAAISSLTPVDVTGLASGATALAVGMKHSCAVAAGVPYCWGANWSGQLGDGTTADRWQPVLVNNWQGVQVTALSAGGDFSCGLSAGGALKCWGGNYYGQLGIGSNISQWEPEMVSGLSSGVTGIAAGNAHACAVFWGGALCWGFNANGQLGDGSVVNRWGPTGVVGQSSGESQVNAGDFHTCALADDGAVTCWGDNWGGQVGDGTTFTRYQPSNVSLLGTGNTSVAGGAYFTCAVTGAGAAKCWGSNSNGQIGDGSIPWQLTPGRVHGISPAVLQINYPNGAPDSFFTLRGSAYQPAADVVVVVNGQTLTPAAGETPGFVVDAAGNFTLTLNTEQADEGRYIVAVEAGIAASAAFVLDRGEPLRPQESGEPVFAIPSGIAYTKIVFLPIAVR